LKGSFAPIDDRRWKEGPQRFPQHPLLHTTSAQKVTSERCGKLDDVATEERHTDFEAVRHPSRIRAFERKVMQVSSLIMIERSLEGTFAR
jgi:hypothetical protein